MASSLGNGKPLGGVVPRPGPVTRATARALARLSAHAASAGAPLRVRGGSGGRSGSRTSAAGEPTLLPGGLVRVAGRASRARAASLSPRARRAARREGRRGTAAGVAKRPKLSRGRRAVSPSDEEGGSAGAETASPVRADAPPADGAPGAPPTARAARAGPTPPATPGREASGAGATTAAADSADAPDPASEGETDFEWDFTAPPPPRRRVRDAPAPRPGAGRPDAAAEAPAAGGERIAEPEAGDPAGSGDQAGGAGACEQNAGAPVASRADAAAARADRARAAGGGSGGGAGAAGASAASAPVPEPIPPAAAATPASRLPPLRGARGRRAAAQALPRGAELVLYVRASSPGGGARACRLPLLPVAGVGDLRGLFRRLILGAYGSDDTLPEYLSSPDFLVCSPREQHVAVPGDSARTGFRLALALNGWEHTLAERELGAPPDPHLNFLVTVAEFESDAIWLGDARLVFNLVSYPTISVRRTFLRQVLANVLAGRPAREPPRLVPVPDPAPLPLDDDLALAGRGLVLSA